MPVQRLAAAGERDMPIISKFLKNISLAASIGLAAMSFTLAPSVAQPAQSLLNFAPTANVPRLSFANSSGAFLHILPTKALRARIKAPSTIAPTGNLTYHAGKIMPSIVIYSIFWTPSHLQDGTAVSLTAFYKQAAATLAVDYPGHGIANNSTQYYQNNAGTLQFISTAGANGGQYTGTSAYPTTHVGGAVCSYTAAPFVNNALNCFTDADLQAEITKVMGIKGWTPGINKMFLVCTEKARVPASALRA
jgi:hypothetical protein